MLTNAPACRTACNGNPGSVVVELVAAFKSLRSQGISEQQALLLSGDPVRVSRLLPIGSPGSLASVARVLVSEGCTGCAVNYAYAERAIAEQLPWPA